MLFSQSSYNMGLSSVGFVKPTFSFTTIAGQILKIQSNPSENSTPYTTDTVVPVVTTNFNLLTLYKWQNSKPAKFGRTCRQENKCNLQN